MTKAERKSIRCDAKAGKTTLAKIYESLGTLNAAEKEAMEVLKNDLYITIPDLIDVDEDECDTNKVAMAALTEMLRDAYGDRLEGL